MLIAFSVLFNCIFNWIFVGKLSKTVPFIYVYDYDLLNAIIINSLYMST